MFSTRSNGVIDRFSVRQDLLAADKETSHQRHRGHSHIQSSEFLKTIRTRGLDDQLLLWRELSRNPESEMWSAAEMMRESAGEDDGVDRDEEDVDELTALIQASYRIDAPRV